MLAVLPSHIHNKSSGSALIGVKQTVNSEICEHLKMIHKLQQFLISPVFFSHYDRLQPRGKHSADEEL